MFDHASMNRAYRLVWSDRHNAYVAAAETAKGRGQRAVRSVAATILLALAATAGSLYAQGVAPPAPAQLPTGGKVVAGQASIGQSVARIDIHQTSQRAAIDWQTFNVGSKAQVNFNQPGANSVTLNRVLDSQPSQIYGRITATGQVYLTNPNGVYFSPTASVDVGGLAATTHSISVADFMAGKANFDRNGATGAVVNQGQLQASLGGYIALLAPEVRNEGVIVAQAGTVALAAGESITLNFTGANTLAGITVTPSQIKALVDNKQAVLAPGGLIILSAQAADRLQGGVVKNSGTVEAQGIARRGGRIVLEGSDRVENTGALRADAGSDGSPAGSISVSAPVIVNAGAISAVQAQAPVVAPAPVATQPTPLSTPMSGGGITLRAALDIIQTTTASIDVSGSNGGGIVLRADRSIDLQGSVQAVAREGNGGSIVVAAPAAVTVSATLDVSGAEHGGQIRVQAVPADPLLPPPPTRSFVTLAGGAQLRAGSSRGRGGIVTVEGETIRILPDATINASGARGGGTVLVGGDWQGSGPMLQATTVSMEKGALIDVSATHDGDGGKAVLWSDLHNPSGSTVFNGAIRATGASAGKGGQVETSGHKLGVRGTVLTGKGGQWLLDPYDVTIDSLPDSNVDGSFNATGSPAVVDASVIAAALTAGGDVTVTTGSGGTEAGNITLNTVIQPGAMPNDATFTLKADRGILMNPGSLIDATQYGNTGKLNVVLWANSSGNGGSIEMGSNSAILSNGGNIVLGGGSDINTGYAIGTGSGESGRGIWLRDGTLLAAHGGNITLRGQGRNGGEGVVLGDPGIGSGNAGSSLLITSGAGAININGRGTTGNVGLFTTGVKLHNDVLLYTETGALNLTGVGGDTLDAGTDNSGLLFGAATRLLSASGPITLTGTVGTGSSTTGSDIRFTTGINYIGHDSGTNLAASSSSITLTADAVRSDTATTILNTSGALIFQPGSASFSNTFIWSGVASDGTIAGSDSIAGFVIPNFADIGGLTIGKAGNLADITLSSVIALNAPLNLIGGSIQIDSPIVLTGQTLTVTHSGLLTTANGIHINAGGGFTQNGTGTSSLGGDISSSNAPIQFSGALTIRNPLTLNSSGGDITLDGAVSSTAPSGSSRLTVNSGTGNIRLQGEISHLEYLVLTSSGMTMQTARMRVDNLLLNGSGGDYVLAQTDNEIGTLAASVDAGSVTLRNGAPLTVGTVDGVNGVISTNGMIYVETMTGHALTISQPVSGPAPTLISGGDLTLGAPVTATIGDLLLVSPGVFVNNAGAGALSTPGRWLVYSNSPYANTFGGLVSGNSGLFGKTYAAYDPGSVAGDGYNGNRYLFVTTENIAVTTTSANSTYGDAPVSLTNHFNVAAANTFGGVIVAPTVSGLPVISSTGSSSTAHAGSYAVVADVSGMSADAPGYNVVAADTGTLTIAPRAVTLSGSRVYDATTAIAAGVLTPGNLVNGDSVTLSGSGILSSKNVGSRGLAGAGSLSLSNSDYTLIGATAAVSITPATLAVGGVTVQNRVYDTTTNGTLTGNATVAPLGADSVSVGGVGSAFFNDKQAGNNKPVTISGYTLLGNDAGNYVVQQPGGLTASITPATLAVSGVTAQNKVYDATAGAPLGGVATLAPLGSDVVSLASSGSAVFSDKNVGNGKAVIVTGFTLTGTDAGNYLVQQPGGLTANIAPATLAISGVSAQNKVYDATNNATLSGAATVMALGSDVVSVGGSPTALFTDKNVGSGKIVSVSGYTLLGADAGNYTVQQPGGLTANISPATLAITGVSAQNRVYDTTTAATLAGTAQVAPLGSDIVSVGGSANAMFGDKNVGNGKAVNVVGYTLGGADAGNYIGQQPGSLTANITPATLAVSGVSAQNKVYDATASATLVGTATVAPLGSDSVSVGGSGIAVFTDKNAGINKGVIVSGYGLTGSDAANYIIQQPGGLTANITPAVLTITGVSAQNKVYDATVIAALTGTGQVAPFGSDSVALGGSPTALFGDKNVGNAKSVTVSGYTLNGTDASNYTVQQPSGLVANITPAPLAVSGVLAQNKVYDATTAAMLTGVATVAALSSDVVSLGGSAVASFGDKNVGSGKAVTVSGYTLLGADAGNYNVQQPGGLTANVTPATLVISGVSAQNKVYDATTNATLGGAATVTALGSDVVSLGGSAVASFGDKNVGGGKTVTVSGYTLLGADAGNYNVQQPGGLTANITPATLAVSGVSAQNKIYDATSTATLTGTAMVTALASDVISIGGVAAAVFSDSAVGTNKPVSVSGYMLLGADAGNYNLQQPAGLSASILAQPVTTLPSRTIATLLAFPPLPDTDLRHDVTERRMLGSGGTLDLSGMADNAEGTMPVASTNKPLARGNEQGPVIEGQATGARPSEYDFPLPRALRGLLDAARSLTVSATRADHSPLPNWLRFDRDGKKFVAFAMPPNALPMSVMLTLGTHKTMVRIAMPSVTNDRVAVAAVD